MFIVPVPSLVKNVKRGDTQRVRKIEGATLVRVIIVKGAAGKAPSSNGSAMLRQGAMGADLSRQGKEPEGRSEPRTTDSNRRSILARFR